MTRDLRWYAEVAERFGLRVADDFEGSGGHYRHDGNDLQVNAARGRREEAVMEAATQQQGISASALARGILERQLQAGEAQVGWEERGASQTRRLETARRILEAVAERGVTSPLEAAATAVAREGIARPERIAEHAIAVLTSDGLREFAPGSGLVTWPASMSSREEARPMADAIADGARAGDAARGEEAGEEPESEAVGIFEVPESMVRELFNGLIRRLTGRSVVAPDEPIPASEVKRAIEDAEEYGAGYLVEGRYVPATAVRVIVADAPEGELAG
ncbi:MAG TPA: hypothetical protein VF192_00935 [Longimicrobiales bacterium]